MKNKGYSLLHVIIIIIITSIVSGLAVGVLLSKGISGSSGANYLDLLEDENVQEFLDVYSQIINEYYEDINKEKAMQSAINGLVTYLDETYTSYLDKDAATALEEKLAGTYYGLGITISGNKIISVYPDSPASKSGFLAGDVLISIDEQDVKAMNNNEISDYIKSCESDIAFVVERNGEKITLITHTEEFIIPSVEYELIENSTIGYMRINVFSKNVASEVKTALVELEKSGSESLIVDLRDNTGGYLEQAYESATYFLEKDEVVYYIENKNEIEAVKDNNEYSSNIPIVVLTNEYTASAAEILAAALRDSYGATIVGRITYGKGKVQYTYSLNNGGLVKYTSSKWLTPKKVCIDNVGLEPDYLVMNEVIYDPTDVEQTKVIDIIDNQYHKAIELLSK